MKKLEVTSSPVCVLRAHGPELRVYTVGYAEAILTLEGDCRAQGPELEVYAVEKMEVVLPLVGDCRAQGPELRVYAVE